MEIKTKSLEQIYAEYDCIFHINLKENKVNSYEFKLPGYEYLRDRLVQNPDYRQLIISYVSNNVEVNERDNMIQNLLPDRMAIYVRSHGPYELEYHTIRDGNRQCHRLTVQKNPDSEDEILAVAVNVEESPKKQAYHIGNRHILYVQDNVDEAKDTNLNYLSKSYKITDVHTREEVFEILKDKSGEITLILMDSRRPCCDFVQMTKDIIKDIRFEDIPVVIITDKEVTHYLEAGVTDCFHPDYNMEMLEQRLNIISKYRDAKAMLSIVEKDPVSGLYTREFFYFRAREIIKTNPDREYSLACFYVDSYYSFLQKYGRGVGSLVLQSVLNTINKMLPGIECISRFKEEYFVILRENIPFDSYEILFDEIQNNLPVSSLSLKIGYTTLRTKMSIRDACDDLQSLIDNIRLRYGVNVAEYDESIRMEKHKEERILSSMEEALEKGQFQVYYQPKYNAQSETIDGAEALIRWMHPAFGFMNPGEFIPIFEKVGFIRGLDRFVIVQVCQNMVRWRAQGRKVVPISVNLSRCDFESTELAEWLIGLTKAMQIPPEWLHLELTESAYSHNPEVIQTCMEQLHNAGFVIELDDFGTGYTSLNILNKIDFDIIKIDKSIIQEDTFESPSKVYEFCMQLAQMMKLKTVVEGVETGSQCKRAKELGADYIQGYYYSRPLPVTGFESLL